MCCAILLWLVLASGSGHAQARRADSLRKVVLGAGADTARVDALNALSVEYKYSNPDTSLLLIEQALQLAGISGYTKGTAYALRHKGGYYLNSGQFTEALRYYLESLKLSEKLNDKKGTATTYGNVGIVYRNQSNYARALGYFFKALAMAKEIGFMQLQANTLGNIGNVYSDQKDYDRALAFFLDALKMNQQMHDKRGIAITLGNIANAHKYQGNYTKALEYYDQCLELAEHTGDKNRIALTLGNIGSVHVYLKNYTQAEKSLHKALELSESIGALNFIKEQQLFLSELETARGNYRQALAHYKKHIVARDSIANEDNTRKQTRMEMQYQFDKQQAADSIRNAEQLKQEALRHEQEIQQQKIYTYGGVAGFVLMLIVAGVSFSAYREKQKANAVISEQKLLVEAKQKEILDSIYYARRIQNSLLPTESYIRNVLKKVEKYTANK